jgi:Raf kinase inhibitor-like YbhB/YbcL family protein
VLALIAASLVLTSPAFQNGGMIPARFTCNGKDISPPLRWTHVPARTQSWAVRLDDPDAPGGTFTHWTAWNFVRGALALRAGAAEHWRLNGTNSFGHVGYSGPCPPPGSAHHYVFRLYALAVRLTLRRGAATSQFAAALRGHVLATARLVGVYRR